VELYLYSPYMSLWRGHVNVTLFLPVSFSRTTNDTSNTDTSLEVRDVLQGASKRAAVVTLLRYVHNS
jgi:hypothetical protein